MSHSNPLNWTVIFGFEQGVSGLTERSRNCLSTCGEDSKASSVRQLCGRVNGLQRQIQGLHYHMQFGRSLQITFLLLLSIVLIGQFNLSFFLPKQMNFIYHDELSGCM